MSTYIIFERIHVEDANCIAGFTYGFPAVTQFLGFTHALSRKLAQLNQPVLKGCAVICHQTQIHSYKVYSDVRFAQNKNPPSTLVNDGESAAKTPPIIEEGKMNMVVSLIMECPDSLSSRSGEQRIFREKLMNLAYQCRLAGGAIQKIQSVRIFQTDQIPQIKRLLLPGFVLRDRSDALTLHHEQRKAIDPNAQLIDSWLDFSAMKFKAEPISQEDAPDGREKTEWSIQKKPAKGWFVPIASGYKAISPVYLAGEVQNARDNQTPFCFVETVHSIGEWQSIHRVTNIKDILWQYVYEEGWYLCKHEEAVPLESRVEVAEETEPLFEDAFMNL